ncbi:MAG: helix-turn-helix transcriptional regulator [Solirubrobacterales bacterium]
MPAEEWISPIGQTITESIEEHEAIDPGFKAERARNRHLREFAKLVAIRRAELGLNQEALAKRMGTSHSVISRLESGRHSFSVATMLKVARALDMKLVIGFEVEGSLSGPGPTQNLVVTP